MAMHFGEMLLARRRQMGVSLQQAANVIKMRPQIIEYFETENFAAMPPRGYAQGMIASYARYLGLNPREVVDAYFDALHEYENRGGRAGRYQDAAFDANPRSSQLPGRYHVMEPERTSSRFAQRPPQAGYVSEEASAHEPMSASRLRPLPMADRRRQRAQGGYDSTQRSRTRDDSHADMPGKGPSAGGPRGRSQRPNTYEGAPRRGASQGYGRPSGGSRRAPEGRGGSPTGATRGRSGRGGGQPPQRGGTGFSQPPFDPKLIAMAAAATLVLIALIAFSLMRGCAPKPEAEGSASSTTVQKVDKTSKDADEDTDDSSESDASSADDAAKQEPVDTSEEEPKEPKVVIKVKEEGVVAWVEVNLDGKSVLGKQVVGPFEQEFTVTSQIDITTDSPNDVAVYKNGKKVRYDTKVSGVAKVSIAAPKIQTVSLTVDTDDDGIADMTAEDALEEGYDVEGRTVEALEVPKKEYENGTVDPVAIASAKAAEADAAGEGDASSDA